MKTTDFRKELLKELEGNILPFWMDRMKDPRGGFYGRIDGKGNIDKSAPKGAVLNARMLWTFSAAYRVLGRKEYLEMATIAKREIIDKFFDREFGGVYWSLDADGRPLDTKKQIYALGFAIYGLSEYARATDDPEAKRYASKLFADIETHSFDPERNGYFEALTRDWKPLEDMRLSEKDQNDSKTMNTHLHIIEPYTNLFRVLPTDKLAERITNLLNVFADRIIRPDGHLGLFFDDEWNSHSDGISFGHDIEASWLLWEAVTTVETSETPDPTPLKDRFRPICLRIADAADKGIGTDGGMRYEAQPDDNDKHWWVQAETVVGNWNAWQMTGDDRYRQISENCWLYILGNIVCPEGEWYWSRRSDGTANTDDDRAGFWKCPYHNSRMCLELIERIGLDD